MPPNYWIRPDVSGDLFLEHEDWTPHKITAHDFAELLKGGSSPVQLALMLCCHSEAVSRRLLECGVAYVVGTRGDSKISDQGALSFSEAFYTKLAQGETALAAFRYGRDILEKTTGVRGAPRPRRPARMPGWTRRHGTLGKTGT
jgi:hypothetical protein